MTAQSNLDTLVTVIGGSGFLGRNVVRALAQRGYRIRVAVRRPDLAGHLQPLGRVGQIHAGAGKPALSGIARRGSARRQRRHQPRRHSATNAAASVSTRCRRRVRKPRRRQPPHTVRAMIQVSAIGADEHSTSAYARSQSLRRTARARRRARRRDFPAVDSVRAGRRFLQPLRRARASLADAAADWRRAHPLSAGRPRPMSPRRLRFPSMARREPGTIYELGGPEIFTFKELMQYVLHTTDRHRAAGAAAVLCRQTAGCVPAVHAEAVADARSGRTPARPTTSSPTTPIREGRTFAALRHHAESDRERLCRATCGASARPASSRATRRDINIRQASSLTAGAGLQRQSDSRGMGP